MRLILVRHAEAASGEPDELRPLTRAGRRAAEALGTRIGGLHPDAVLSSPLQRALETALPIALEAGVEVEPDERLAPGATLAAVREVVEDRGETVVVVGHQPDCGLIVAELTGREARFPPGAAYEVDL